MKYKVLFNGTLTTCDGSRHTYHQDVPNQPGSALCWCHGAEQEQLARWSTTEKEARVRRATGELTLTD